MRQRGHRLRKKKNKKKGKWRVKDDELLRKSMSVELTVKASNNMMTTFAKGN